MTSKLHTVIAVRDGVKNRRTEELTALHRESQKADLFDGLTRTYRPKDDDGDALPAENKNIQLNGDTVLNGLVEAVARSWNLMATVDHGNQRATADVEVPTGATTAAGEPIHRTILTDVPAQFLLYLSRELDDVHTFLKKLPVLDPAHRWEYDENVMAYVAEPVTTHRTKKVLRNHVKYPATERHPAQVDTFTEDEVVGYWTSVKRSGALPLERKARLLQRVDVLRIAVREARERANEVDVTDVEVARPVFDFLFGDER